MSFVVLVLLQFQLVLRLKFRTNKGKVTCCSEMINRHLAKDIGKPKVEKITLDRFDDLSAMFLGSLYFLSILIYWIYFITVS